MIYELALQRSGYPDFRSFQTANGLHPSGTADAATAVALLPYLLGYRLVTVREGDTLSALATAYRTTVQRILTANPSIEPENLQIGSRITVPLGFEVVPTDVPFSSELLALSVQGLLVRYPFLQSETLTYTAFGRPLTLLRVGIGQRRVLYNASHHANEWITTPVLLHFLEEYCEAIVQQGEIEGVAAQALYEAATLAMVPMVNPDGVDLVTGALAEDSEEYLTAQQIAAGYPSIPFPDGWKANLNGVDLNLNYPAEWEQAKQIKFEQGYTKPAPRDFVGGAPLDQRESAAMAALTSRFLPQLTLSYHTQGRVIYWKFLDYNPPGAEAKAEAFAASSGYALETTPYASGFAGYKDWFIQTWNLPGYTIEAGLGENPLPLTQFDEIYRENRGILVEGMLP